MVELTGALAGVGLAVVLLVPLTLKWQLPMRIVGPWMLVIGAATGAAWAAVLRPGTLPWPWWPAEIATILVLSAAGAVACFFRDPEREPPGDPRAIVSPADGKILYVRRFQAGEAPPVVKQGRSVDLREFSQVEITGEGHLIGIGMHLLNVHVNRAPVGGRVTSLVHTPGLFISLRREGATSLNERFTTVIEAEQTRVVVVQIASRLVRRIVSYLTADQHVAAGQRIGMIKFGSQVDVILPTASSEVLVEPGDLVRAGVSILAYAGDQRPRAD